MISAGRSSPFTPRLKCIAGFGAPQGTINCDLPALRASATFFHEGGMQYRHSATGAKLSAWLYGVVTHQVKWSRSAFQAPCEALTCECGQNTGSVYRADAPLTYRPLAGRSGVAHRAEARRVE